MTALLLLNKPYNVLCQFSPSKGTEAKTPTLKDYVAQPNVYPAGRLDKDSEGLVALTDDGALQNRISHPKKKLPKSYWVQVEGQVEQTTARQLSRGVLLKDGPTLPAQVKVIAPPPLWPRSPAVSADTTSWLEIELKEGRNRQVRRMTAAVGHPTLRLVRWRIGPFTLDALKPGEFRRVPVDELKRMLQW